LGGKGGYRLARSAMRACPRGKGQKKAPLKGSEKRGGVGSFKTERDGGKKNESKARGPLLGGTVEKKTPMRRGKSSPFDQGNPRKNLKTPKKGGKERDLTTRSRERLAQAFDKGAPHLGKEEGVERRSQKSRTNGAPVSKKTRKKKKTAAGKGRREEKPAGKTLTPYRLKKVSPPKKKKSTTWKRTTNQEKGKR